MSGSTSNEGPARTVVCERCNASLWGVFNRVATLAGNYRALLCTGCLNAWEIFIREHALLADYNRLEYQEHQLAHMVSHDGQSRDVELMEVWYKKRDLNRRLFDLASDWCGLQKLTTPTAPTVSPDEQRRILETNRESVVAQLRHLDLRAATLGAY